MSKVSTPEKLRRVLELPGIIRPHPDPLFPGQYVLCAPRGYLIVEEEFLHSDPIGAVQCAAKGLIENLLDRWYELIAVLSEIETGKNRYTITPERTRFYMNKDVSWR